MPGSAAERLGLRPGDVIASRRRAPITRTLEETIERVEAGAEIVVLRQQEGGIWLDLTLGQPDTAPAAPAQGEASAQTPVPTAEEQEAAWQERMNERLFVFENGGWQVVEGWRRRLGPKDGEIWVDYEEMREIERTGQGPGTVQD
jgi:hypothetical protein